MKHPFVRTALAAAMLSALSLPALADADVEARLKAMEARLNAVESENQALKNQLKATDEKTAAASAQIEKVATATSSEKSSWAENTQLGGYGELHYNNLDGEGGASDKDEIDFHRFVLFFGHQFTDRIRFFSELEVEHSFFSASSGKGEIEIEQAYLEFDLNANHRAKAGLFLLPVGILNETHEPPVFYGVERNPVEAAIIPSTWWAGGIGLSGNLGAGFGYDLAVHEGLNTNAGASYAVRSGRQKTSEARATDLATTARLSWTGVPGLTLAGSFQHQTDITQGLDPTAGSANLFEAHGVFNRGPFGLKALYARWDLDGSGPAAVGADEQMGWYVEPAFRLNERWGVFARYNAWDNRAGISGNTGKQQTNFGVNFWPHSDVVLKADYQTQDNDDDKNQNGFNLGVGYQF
ncbi:MAG TPA: carbohydrate porin [Thiobacillus sp.]|nr:MAG: porin [Hydrogenophilales bacterium 28-61-11]OYZ57813.1 MAG: porin [Hydrogenophilales bacterium 16-61-112]OZA48643.1 MAG: porin [Hydrogenophilales bacterium 17-61-76]HQT34727.1 carbohydrate porin [Thiobacillus sp.]HQT69913.1 carbohydrate porin [Thiobacillus sp.]